MKGRDIYADLEKIEQRGKRKKKRKDRGLLPFGLKKGEPKKDEPVAEPEPKPEVAYQPERQVNQEQEGKEIGQDGPSSGTEPEITLVQSEPTPEPEQGEQSKPTPADVSLPRPPEPVEEYVPPPEGGGVVIGLEAERPRETKSPQSFTAPAMEELPSPSHQEEPPAHPTPQPPDDAAQPAPTSVIEPAYKPVSEGVQPRPEAPPIGEASVESTRTPPSGKELAKAEAHLTAYKRWLNQGFKAGLVSREECQVMTQDKEVKLGLRPPQ